MLVSRRRTHGGYGVQAVVASVLLAVLGVTAAAAPGPAAAAGGVSVTESSYRLATDGFKARRLQAIGAIAVAESVVASAQLALDTSVGKVLGNRTRIVLAGRIRYETARIAQAQEEVDRGNELIDPTPRVGNYFSALPGAHEVTALLESAEFTEAVRLREGRGRLAGPVRAVSIAVVAWRAEQKRLAAAKARAARAARALSVTVARARLHSRAIVAPARPGRSTPARAAKYTKNVWTAGWQAQIDACRGAVDVTGHYGVRVIAEHWGCGGSRFPRSGTVRLSGRYAGTYKVGRIVAVLDVRSQGTRNVPRGYGLLYQTCLNGSNATMAFRVLTRVG